MPQEQTALAVTELGSPLRKITRPIPEPKEGQVLLKVTIAGLNPHDAKARDWGLFTKNHLPAVLASDVAGIVLTVGPNVTKFKPGDHIFGQTSLLGSNLGGVFNFGPPNWDTAGLQEYAILETRFAALVPAGVSDAEAATLPSNLIPVVIGLFDESCLGFPAPWDERASMVYYQGTSILIIGGGSNTGKFAIQVSSLMGIGRIIVVSGQGSAEEARALGATHIIDRSKSSSEIAAEVRAIVGEDLVYAFDTINTADNQHVGVEALSNTKKGKLARLVPLGAIDEAKLLSKKEAGYQVLDVLGVSAGKPDIATIFWERVSGWLEDGRVKPTPFNVIKGLNLDEINKILDNYANGTTSGQWQIHL